MAVGVRRARGHRVRSGNVTTPTGTTPAGRTSPDLAGPEFAVNAVLLDLDGTLVDSEQALVRAWSRWSAEHGITREELAAVVMHGLTAHAIVEALVPPHAVDAARRRIDELETHDAEGVTAMPGAHAFLAGLPAGRWAIVTSGIDAVARARLRAAGLPAPDLLVSADDVRRGKPDPEPFLQGAARLGVEPTRCLVVEDSPAGLAAALAAGMACVAVTTTHAGPSLDANVVVAGVHELSVAVAGRSLTIVAAG